MARRGRGIRHWAVYGARGPAGIGFDFGTLPDGAPLLRTDAFVIARVDPLSETGYTLYSITAEALAAFLGITLSDEFLLLEDGSFLLLESGDKIIL